MVVDDELSYRLEKIRRHFWERFKGRTYLSLHEVAEYLNVSERTIYRMVARGELFPHKGKYSRRLMFHVEDVEEYIVQGILRAYND